MEGGSAKKAGGGDFFADGGSGVLRCLAVAGLAGERRGAPALVQTDTGGARRQTGRQAVSGRGEAAATCLGAGDGARVQEKSRAERPGGNGGGMVLLW